MAFNSIPSAWITVKKAVAVQFGQYCKDNFDYLYSKIFGGGSEPPNGSFEIDSDSDGMPDNWDKNLYAGGSFALDTTTPAHGATAVKFTDPGGVAQGGGYLDSDYVEVSEYLTYFLAFMLKCSVAGVDVRAEIREYDTAKAYQSTQTLYSSTSNPTSWTAKRYQITPAASIAYVKIRLIGGHTATNQAGDIYFDNIRFGQVAYSEALATASVDQVAIGGSAVGRVELKTTTSSVSTNSLNFVHLILSGGAYGFYPQIKGSLASVPVSARIADNYLGVSYATIIAIKTADVSYPIYVRQRYVTSSGKEHWIFLLVDKLSGYIQSAYEAPDHPMFGNGDDEIKVPHPFADYLDRSPADDGLEIILVDIDTDRKSVV